MLLRRYLTFVLSLSGCLFIAGCGSGGSSSPARYPITHAGSVKKVEKGTVVSVRQVKIDGVATNLGAIVGAGIGGAAGSLAVPLESKTVITQTSPTSIQIHGSNNVHESRAAMGVGAAVGAVVGQKVEKAMTAKRAQELTIALDGGETVSIVQEYREPAFYEDDRVELYTTRIGNSVVYHMGSDPTLDPDTNAYLISDEATEEFETVTW